MDQQTKSTSPTGDMSSLIIWICPGCDCNINDVDGIAITEERTACFKGEGDVCVDGNLWCLECLSEERCPCIVREPASYENDKRLCRQFRPNLS